MEELIALLETPEEDKDPASPIKKDNTKDEEEENDCDNRRKVSLYNNPGVTSGMVL
jgi:hypothetical protein